MRLATARLLVATTWLVAVGAAYIPFGLEKALTGSNVPIEFLDSARLTGDFPFVASRSDPRISYAVYVPMDHYIPTPNDTHPKLPLLIDIHGTARDISGIMLADAHRGFAEETPCAVVQPLFPAGLEGINDMDTYKVLRSESFRYDLALLDIVDEIAHRWPGVETSKFFMMGYSGGGQFGQRFLYLHPERLAGISIGAPGVLTSLDYEKDWPQGIANVEDLFNRTVDMDLVRQVPIRLVVGDQDTQISPGDEWLSGVLLDVGHPTRTITRVDIIKGLQEELRAKGIEAPLEVVPGIGHAGASPEIRSATYAYLGPMIKGEPTKERLSEWGEIIWRLFTRNAYRTHDNKEAGHATANSSAQSNG